MLSVVCRGTEMQILLSVIVPVYNMEKYLPQCIDSILHQSLEDIEVILVDDGSGDSSGRIIDEYAEKDRRVRAFHQENGGPIEARKKGVTESRGEYVTFVDADDFIAPVSYILAVPSMEKSIDLVIFGITRYFSLSDQRTEYGSFAEGIYDKQAIETKIRPEMIWDYKNERFCIDPSLCNKVIKRKLVLSAYRKLENARFHYGEDIAIMYPVMKDTKTLEIKRQSYYYHRKREKTVSPGYITDEDYFIRLFDLYSFMKNEFQDDKVLLRQIEYFYMYSVNLRRRIYGDYAEQIKYMFPFDKVEKGQKVVIYGAGAAGCSYVEQLKRIEYCQVVLWVDRNYKKELVNHVSAVEKIKTVRYDRVVIAITNGRVRDSVKEMLVGMGINEKQIVW